MDFNFYFLLIDFSCFISEFFLIIVSFFFLIIVLIFTNPSLYSYTTKLQAIFLVIPVVLLVSYSVINMYFFFSFNYFVASNYIFHLNGVIIFLKSFFILLSATILLVSYPILRQIGNNLLELITLYIYLSFGVILILISFDFIFIYLAIELQSLCFFVLISYQKQKNKAVEAGLKYFILGAFSSCFFLVGIAIIYGAIGSTNFQVLMLSLTYLTNQSNLWFMLMVAFTFIIIGLFFKLAVAPFHIWMPDVFDGTSRFIIAVFSLLPKMSLVFLLYELYNLFLIKLSSFWLLFFFFFAFFSWFVGLLGAINAKSINKFFAYSSISHIGFFLFSVIFYDLIVLITYILIYSLILVNIFSILFYLIRFNTYKELLFLQQLIYFKKVHFVASISFLLSFLSLCGIPPLSGFFGKFFIFITSLSKGFVLFTLFSLIIGVLSCCYYLRVVKLVSFINTKFWLFLFEFDTLSSYIISFTFVLNLVFILLLPIWTEWIRFLIFFL